MDLQDTIEKYVMQLKNENHTLRTVVKVCKLIMATLYDTYFPDAEALRPGPKSLCPDSDILTISWLLELIGKDSECAGYKLIKAELSDLFSFYRNALASIGDDGTFATQAKNSDKF